MEETRELDNADEVLEIPISYEERGKEIGKGLEMGNGNKIWQGDRSGRNKREIVLKYCKKVLGTNMIMNLRNNHRRV